MTEQHYDPNQQGNSGLKVYELAKELGIDSISLLDRLKGLKISVKNHMSDLRPDEVALTRSSLKPQSSTEKKSAKSASAAPKIRKKAAADSTSAAPESKATAPLKATPGTTVTRRAATSSKEIQPATASAATPAPTGGASSPIIRRRTSAEGMTETISGGTAASRAAAATHSAHSYEVPSPDDATADEARSIGDEPQLPLSAPESVTDTETELAPAGMVSSADPETHLQSPDADSLATGAAASAATEIDTDRVVAAGPMTGVALPIDPELPVGVSPSTSTPDVQQTSGVSPAALIRKAVVLPPRPVAPRRNVLTIVTPTVQPPRPMVKAAQGAAGAGKTGPGRTGTGTGGTEKEPFRITKLTKENLDQLVEEEAKRKRGLGGKESEVKPEDVNFADFRKKEMVFLPRRKKIPVGRELKRTQITTPKAQKRVIEVNQTISVRDLADQMAVKATDVIRKLMNMGQIANINQALDFDTASVLATEYQYEIRNVAFQEKKLLAQNQVTDLVADLAPRPPVVTIMGHVDHGKTSLLDAIREANVAGGEAGGITQHIGAYTVEKMGKLITFIDTPGHEAFAVMRARGANVTDIVVLVVAADDGVMPQTREAISHAKAAKVPIIVAVNKIDKPGSNPEKIKQSLAELELLAEDWGGDTMFVPVSAIKKTNLDKLLESILLQAEVLDLKANANAPASGTVLEARLDKGRGPVVSVLIKRGTLKVGDAVVSGSFVGKVRSLTDYKGKAVREVLPGTAGEILGFEGVPNAGEAFDATTSDSAAREIAENRGLKQKQDAFAPPGKLSLEELFSKIKTGNVKELGVVLKADAFGSVEAIRDSLIKASTDKVKVRVLHAATGGITESDVLLASASNAIIIGFNVRPETKARQLAEQQHIEIKCYNIIYEVLDEIKKAMTGMLDKKKVEKYLGRAEVRQTFTVPKIGTIAGCGVVDGKVLRGANVRLLRDSRIIYEGKMSSLRRFKDDAKEVAEGFECGIGIENFNDLKSGDLIEAYVIELVAPEL